MRQQKAIIFLLFFFFLGHPLNAFHIIGGEITYVCIGDGNYEFTMRIYRDCQGGGACFDSEDFCDGEQRPLLLGTVTIFEDKNPITGILLDKPIVTKIIPNISNPCLIFPPNICVEEGVYKFKAKLPISSKSYTISYQRCCRNSTIVNVSNPDRIGATYTTEIRPLAQQTCNSSPVFNDFPPIVICRGEDIDFDHSATDPEGDSLVYSFCTPYIGGGLAQGFSVNGVAPDPESPPPYESVRYIPPYSFINALNQHAEPGVPRVKINRNTGLISGFPNTLGQFVVGVCVRAYIDGQLVNEVRRDFQFNVANCTPTVFGDVEEQELKSRNGKPLYYVKFCGADAKLVNESTIKGNINSLLWSFDVPGGQITSNLWDGENLVFPSEGIYDGTLILNPGLQCNDTALIQVDVQPDINADFSFEYDTCNLPVTFIDLSTSDAGTNTIVDWQWDFKNGDFSDQRNLTYFYDKPGNYRVSLSVRDINGCEETVTKPLSYFPIPEFLVIAPSAFKGCLPSTISFGNLSTPIDESYDIIWDFGDGSIGTEVSPTHLYEEEGIFTISLDVTSPFGCQIDTVWERLITMLQSPIADFTYNPQQVSNFEPDVQFTDQSVDANYWQWNFNNLGFSFDPNPMFSFINNGPQLITLEVGHENGCIDTTSAIINVIPEIRYKLPNAFTPNGDGINDLFFGNGNAEDATEFRLAIWDRYGEKLFETQDPEEGWNGRKNNIGEFVINGVYIVTVSYKDFFEEVIFLKGFATVIR